MPLVTVKPKFQITIPAKLRRDINLHEGDLLEATITGDGILLRPMDVVDRNTVADRIAANFAATQPSSEDIGRTEDEIMQDTIADGSTKKCGAIRQGTVQLQPIWPRPSAGYHCSNFPAAYRQGLASGLAA